MALSVMLMMPFNSKINAQSIMNNVDDFQQIFPHGEKLPEKFSKYFIGQAYLAPLTTDNSLHVPASNVTFEPGCRNNWHSHTGGQILLCTAGRGYYQEKDKPARELFPGDVVEIAPDVIHWHGAAPDSWFSHIAIECNPDNNKATWLEPVNDEEYKAATLKASPEISLSEAAVNNHNKWFPGYVSKFPQTDPDLIEIFDNFAFDEVIANSGAIDMRTRILVTMASTIARNAVDEYLVMMGAALSNGISPVEIKEVLYQSVAYVGMSTVLSFVKATNAEFSRRDISLPIESQTTVTRENRLEKGQELIDSIFGRGMVSEDNVPANQKHFQRFLADNCFGDYQTRTGLTPQMRELLTFSMLISLGGCENQVKGHIRGNVSVGNSKEILLAVVTQLLPYNGYPRTLNALACLNEIIPEK